MKYTIEYTGSSKVAASLATQLSQGKAGEILITAGFSQETFCAFLANLAVRAISAKYKESDLAGLFVQMAAGNASQARQALAEVTLKLDGSEPQSLGKYFAKSDGKAKIDVSALAKL